MQKSKLILADGREYEGVSFGSEGEAIGDSIKNGEISLVINSPMGARSRFDEEAIGRACIQNGVFVVTTLSGADVALRAIRISEKNY